MEKVKRSELLDLGAYEQVRPQFRARVIELKKNRRLDIGDHMSLLFENHDTILLQVQEMLRTERISDEQGIAHELETYNEMIPEPGSLAASLFIEYDDREQRHTMLRELANLEDHMQLRLADSVTKARFGKHFGQQPDYLPAVNYLLFPVGAQAARTLDDENQPALLEVTHPAYQVTCELPPKLRRELLSDLS